MIKRISAYTIHCDACGRRLGGPFGSSSTAYIFAIGNGLAKTEEPYYVYCSRECKEKLEAALPKPEKDQ